jgi:hypothetical protein
LDKSFAKQRAPLEPVLPWIVVDDQSACLTFLGAEIPYEWLCRKLLVDS